MYSDMTQDSVAGGFSAARRRAERCTRQERQSFPISPDDPKCFCGRQILPKGANLIVFPISDMATYGARSVWRMGPALYLLGLGSRPRSLPKAVFSGQSILVDARSVVVTRARGFSMAMKIQ